MVDLSVDEGSGVRHKITFWTDWYQPIDKDGGDSSFYEDGLDYGFANDTITTTFSGGCSGLINFTPENFSFGIKGDDVADVRFRTKFHYSLDQVYVFSSRGEGFQEKIADIWTPWINTYIGKEPTGWRYRLFCMDTLQFDRKTFEDLKEKARKTNQFVFYDKADSLRYDNPDPMSLRMYTYFIPYVREHFHVDYETADNLGDLSINIWMGDFITEIEIIFKDGTRKTLVHKAKHIFAVA